MLDENVFLHEMLQLYLIVLIGFIFRKVNILKSNTNEVITQMMLYITLPALILYALQTTFSKELIVSFVWLNTMSIFILSVSVFLAALLRKKATLPTKQKSVYESLIIFGNQGFLGFAVVYILMAEQGIIYVTFFNIIYLILIWTYGIYLFSKKERSINWITLLINPGTLATMIGVVMLFLPYNWPSILYETFEAVGKMTIPLSMMLIGSLIASIETEKLKQYITNKYLWIATVYRLLLLPLTLLLFILFSVPFPLLLVAVLTSAMPSASTISLYAQKFGDDAPFASVGVFITTVLCIVTIPLLYAVMQWIEHYFY